MDFSLLLSTQQLCLSLLLLYDYVSFSQLSRFKTEIQTTAASVAAGSARHKQSHTSVCLKTPPLPSQQEITQCYNEGAGLYVEN
jgi:hypothetical protein